MVKQDSNTIIKSEIEAILADVIALYNSSGKRTSGRFEDGLKATYGDNKATIEGYTYLAGRRAGKMPPVASIKEWIIKKGIKPVEESVTINSLAWAIAKTIAKTGTKKVNHLKIYEQVITPERINLIINKVSEFNVNLFVQELTASLTLLQKNI